LTVDELQVLITANTTALRKEIANANKNIASLQKSASKSTAGVSSAFSKLKTGIIALGIGKVIKDSIQSGMDAIESDSLFETVMGDNAAAVKSWSNTVADALGLSAVAMQKNIGVIYNMTSSMGVAGDNALKMSKGVSVLAEDMASFYNLDSTEAFNKLRAGLTGETEPLKALGILVDENTVKQVAYSQGIAEVGAELTNEQKVLARYTAILNQTSNAQGDLARTLNSPSNMLRSLKQSVTNLGIAFSQILMPVVQAVLPWLNALAKVATQAVNSLSSLFGVNTKGLSTETQKVKTNTAGMGADFDKANKNAKKLKQSLAGFDEMNVLQDNSSADDSAAGASVGGAVTVPLDFEIGEYDAHLDWVDSQTAGLVDAIQKEFASIGEGIDFSKLTQAFKKLKKAVEPITNKIWNGLKWAYDNILKPLAQWTIGEAVPAFMNGLSGTLTLLNPLLEAFQKVGGWLWDNFLSPIAEWTGGIIVDTMNGVGEALTAIGEWASANQGVIDTMVAAFATFFGLWELTKILAFIEMSGGLVAAFGNVTKAIWACTGAKIADKAETMYLTALYAKDTAAKALNAIKTGLVTAAQAAWNAICVVASAVTTALGAAFNFLTSPIGLVVLAIAAVIAIVVVCIKHWDEIKEAASKCWEGIKNVWNVVASWFNEHIIQPVAGFFSGLWNGFKDGAKKAWEGVKSVFSAVGGFFKDVFSKAWKGIVSVFSTAGEIFVNIKDGIVSVFKTVVNGIIKGINTVVKLPFEGFNKVLDKIHGIEVAGVKPFKWLTWRAPIPQIPELAQGGIVDRPTYAMIGEAGKEAVMPLERNTGWIDQLADKLADKIGGGNGDIKLTVKLGEDTIFDKFIEYGRAKSFETNGEVVFA
jgi:hypothetical protein